MNSFLFVLTCDPPQDRYVLAANGAWEGNFTSLEEALAYAGTVCAGARLRAVTPEGEPIMETRV